MGKFVKGTWIEGLTEDMIGKKIIHVGRCKTPYGYDGSFCTVSGIGNKQDPKYEYVILNKINGDGSIVVEWQPSIFPGSLATLEPHWNDDNWIEYVGE